MTFNHPQSRSLLSVNADARLYLYFLCLQKGCLTEVTVLYRVADPLAQNKPTNRHEPLHPNSARRRHKEQIHLTGVLLSLQMDSLTAWILIAAYRVPAKISPTAVVCLIPRISLAKVYRHHLSKLPSPSTIESVSWLDRIAPMCSLEKVLSTRG